MSQFSTASSTSNALPVAGRVFAADSPIGDLYKSSLARGNHFEGPDALRGAIAYVQELQEFGVERASPALYHARIQAALGFARAVFENIPEVEAVVLHGSALRGKVSPKDFDARLVTSFHAHEVRDYMYPVMNNIQERVDRAFKGTDSIPKTIALLPVEVSINTAYYDISGMELDFVERGPYLAILRGTGEAGSFRESYPMFLNTSGREYLNERAA